MNVKILQDQCTGCGICPSICPDVFELNDEGVAEVKADPVPESMKDEVVEAAESCPVGAIAVTG